MEILKESQALLFCWEDPGKKGTKIGVFSIMLLPNCISRDHRHHHEHRRKLIISLEKINVITRLCVL